MKQKINPVFVVGCARSGTTLLQAMLCSHSRIISFPESQFFPNIIDQYDTRVFSSKLTVKKKFIYWYQKLLENSGIAPRPYSGLCSINRFLKKAHVDDKHYRPSLGMLLIKNQVDIIKAIMDQAAWREDKSVWLMKTPANVSYIDVIERYIKDPIFIHIVRPGKDVVASIYDAAIKHPDTVWQKHFYRGDLHRLSAMWNAAIRQTIKYHDCQNHMVVLYEDLVNHAENELSRIFDFLGLDNEPGCSKRYAENATGIVSNNEKWKKGLSEKLAKRDKYNNIFNKSQKELIESSLLEVNLKVEFCDG